MLKKLKRALLSRFSPKRVLVVEDDQNFQLLFKQNLDVYFPSVEVFMATSMENAFAQLRARKYDLMICAQNLADGGKGMEIWNVCKYEFPRMPILFASGISEEKISEKSLRMNETPSFLSKPFKSDEFKRALDKLLRG